MEHSYIFSVLMRIAFGLIGLGSASLMAALMYEYPDGRLPFAALGGALVAICALAAFARG